MSEIKVVSTEDPEYYAELLREAGELENRCLPFDEQFGSCSVLGIQNSPLFRRLQPLLDGLANISLCRQGNASATMASLNVDKRTPDSDLETRLYIIFNHEDDEAAGRCAQHLESVFDMLSQVPYMPPSIKGSRKFIPKELEDNLIIFCRAIHNYSFEIFTHRVTKHEHKLSDIRRYIEKDRSHFTEKQYSALMVFLLHMKAITTAVANAQATKQLSAAVIKGLLHIYSYWTEYDILPKDGRATNNDTSLDLAVHRLADST
jgi:plasmid stabilization system protein ParE